MKFVQIVEEPGWNRRIFRGGRLTRKREIKDSLGGPFAALPHGCAASLRTCRSSRFFSRVFEPDLVNIQVKDLSFFLVLMPASQRLAAHRNGAAEMKQILQKVKTGEVTVTDVPAPTSRSGCVLVRAGASLISVGTERLTVEAGQKNLLGRAVAQPALVKHVLHRPRTQGSLHTLDAVRSKLGSLNALGDPLEHGGLSN